MTHQVFRIKRGDRAPALRLQLLDATTPVNLTSATAVRLLLANDAGALVVDEAMAVDSGQGDVPAPGATTGRGWCQYAWQVGDTDVAAVLRLEVEVTWADGTKQTFPPDSTALVYVSADLG